ncbi:MAG: glycosyltransferase family 9 protein [Chloroflexi bacterium]|nr:glycosyltransferase family 9 protein [Chloroflexota bacterium]
MTTPALRALKSLHPGVQLTLLTSHMGSGIARFIPQIDSIIEFDVPWMRLDGLTGSSQQVFDLINRLKQEQFDAAAIFSVFSQNPLPAALLCYLADIPLRLAACRENPYGLLTDWLPDTEPMTGIEHEVARQLKLVSLVGANTSNLRLSLTVPAEAKQASLDKLCRAGINPQQPWLVLHPGVSEARRRYPPERYAEAGRELVRRGLQIAVTGGKAEKALTDEVAEHIGVGAVSLGSLFPLGELIGLIEAAPLLIANNTGPVHIAAAVGTPVVVLYAHTNPQHTPWNVPNRVLYFDVPEAIRSKSPLLAYTYQKTVPQPVRDTTPKDIVAAVTELLAEVNPLQRPG